MGRIISEVKRDQIAALHAADPEMLGPMMGVLITEGNVPIEAVAKLLNVSEPTIYRWIYGTSAPRDLDKIDKIKRLLTVLRKAKRAKDLPLEGTFPERVKAVKGLVIAHKPPVRT